MGRDHDRAPEKKLATILDFLVGVLDSPRVRYVVDFRSASAPSSSRHSVRNSCCLH